MKTELKQEESAPSHSISASGYNASASSYNAPSSAYNTSDSYQPWQQQQQPPPPQQGHKRTFDEARGRGYYEYRENKRYVQTRIRYIRRSSLFLIFPKHPGKEPSPAVPSSAESVLRGIWDLAKCILFIYSTNVAVRLILLSCKDCKGYWMKNWALRVGYFLTHT